MKELIQTVELRRQLESTILPSLLTCAWRRISRQLTSRERLATSARKIDGASPGQPNLEIIADLTLKGITAPLTSAQQPV
jgi:hypothetical protein